LEFCIPSLEDFGLHQSPFSSICVFSPCLSSASPPPLSLLLLQFLIFLQCSTPRCHLPMGVKHLRSWPFLSPPICTLGPCSHCLFFVGGWGGGGFGFVLGGSSFLSLLPVRVRSFRVCFLPNWFPPTSCSPPCPLDAMSPRPILRNCLHSYLPCWSISEFPGFLSHLHRGSAGHKLVSTQPFFQSLLWPRTVPP